MSYSKVSNKTPNKDVKYLSKDYNSFVNQLVEFSEVYFPNNFNDFSEGNPGMMFMEMAAYVGDVLSFYTDSQIQETFLSLAQDKENIYNMAYAMGYKPKTTTAANVDLTLSHLVPSKLLGGIYMPDYDYSLNIKSDSSFASTEGPSFYLQGDCNFNVSSSYSAMTTSIFQYDASGNPEYYLLEKKQRAIAGNRKTKKFPIGRAQRFNTVTLFDRNLIHIESMIDSEGNNWYEVPYLAQETIFEEAANTAANDPTLHQYNHQTPYLLKLKKVPKRYITRVKPNGQTEIQFGSGTNAKSDEQIIPNPDNIGLGIKDGRSKLDIAYDPSNFLYTRAYGQAPANTTLTVTYLVGGGITSNVNSNTINQVKTLKRDINQGLNTGMVNFTVSSLAANNLEAASGGGGGETVEEVRMNTMANFSSQQRTVTKEDYIIRTLSMPSQLGNIVKAFITQDDQISPITSEPNRIPNPLALNLYTLGYNKDKQLTTLNSATKTNLATYLEQYRMLTDAVNIKDAFVINFGLNFEITTFKNYNNNKVLLQCISDLQNHFQIEKWQINQPIIISEVKNLIGAVKGVQTVEKVEFINKNGVLSGYTQYRYPMNQAIRNEIIYPSLDPSIFELKYPNTDIKGQVTTY